MNQVFILMAAVAVFGCAEDANDAAIRENAANDIDARVVRLRIDIDVQVPDDVRPDLAVLVNGEAQEIVDVPIDPQADRRGPDPEGEEFEPEVEPVPVLGYALVHYERMMAWGGDGSSHDTIQAVDARSGQVRGEKAGFLQPVCSSLPPPAPLEVYYKAKLNYLTLPGDEQPQWRIYLTALGCVYADPERNIDADV